MRMRVRASKDRFAQTPIFECCKLNSLVKTLIIHSRWELTLRFRSAGILMVIVSV